MVETISGGLYAKDLTDMKIKQDVVNRALDLMEQNGVKYFGIISNGGGGHAGAAGFVLDVTDVRFREFIEKHKLISQ